MRELTPGVGRNNVLCFFGSDKVSVEAAIAYWSYSYVTLEFISNRTLLFLEYELYPFFAESLVIC
ncbi:unnamed protein product [Linum tenue]|uniref:Uncharacterized protein n=1 Tax=Linum tenue TaxID=586396 RepID=A0AAV0NFM9_9ROSI|nr:unnamed protein product [Linum tenue]